MSIQTLDVSGAITQSVIATLTGYLIGGYFYLNAKRKNHKSKFIFWKFLPYIALSQGLATTVNELLYIPFFHYSLNQSEFYKGIAQTIASIILVLVFETIGKQNQEQEKVNQQQVIQDSNITNDTYAEAMNEFESKNIQKGLWAKSFANANGDENKAKAFYLQERSVEIQKSKNIKNVVSLDSQKPKNDNILILGSILVVVLIFVGLYFIKNYENPNQSNIKLQVANITPTSPSTPATSKIYDAKITLDNCNVCIDKECHSARVLETVTLDFDKKSLEALLNINEAKNVIIFDNTSNNYCSVNGDNSFNCSAHYLGKGGDNIRYDIHNIDNKDINLEISNDETRERLADISCSILRY